MPTNNLSTITKEVSMGIGSWLYTNSNKSLRVKIVHPGGHAELHDRPVLAAEIIRRNPKCCVAHPNVFKQPWAIVQPDTMLMPGQKVYVVPISTIRKLQKLSIKKSILSGNDQASESFTESGEEGDLDSGETSCCSLEDSFKGGNQEPEENKKCFICVFSGPKRKAHLVKEGASTLSSGRSSDRRNGKSGGSPKKLISTLDYWQPNLHSIVEEKSVGIVEDKNFGIVEEKNIQNE